MREIELTQGYVALVDDEDFDLLSGKWQIKKSGRNLYAHRMKWNKELKKYQNQKMHRLILGITDPSIEVDHIDHNGLNNQKSNLRVAKKSENMMNQRKRIKELSSSYKGVRWNRKDSRWESNICIDKKQNYIGQFDYEILAALAYDGLALIFFGNFSFTNFDYETI